MRRLAALLGATAMALPAPAWAEDAGFLTRQLQDLLSDAGREVRIRGFQGALSSRATIAEMTIADDDGVWLTLRGAELDWNRAALLRRRLSVNALTAEEIIFDRPPDSGPGAPPSPEATPFALPELPVDIDIRSLRADRVVLGAAVLGSPVALRLDGSAQLGDGDGTAELVAERIDDAEGRFALAGSFSNTTRALSVDVDLNEGADGIAATLLDLPGRPPLRLVVDGDGLLSDFTADLALETEGEPRLAGQIHLRDEDDAQGFAADIAGDVRPLFTPEFHAFFGPEARLDLAGRQHPDGGLELDRLTVANRELDLRGSLLLAPGGRPERVDLQGRVAGADGGPVVLPLGGPRTAVDRLTLEVDFDAATGPDWIASAVLEGLDRADFAARRMALTVDGRLDTAPNAVDAEVTLEATGLAPADPALAAALGDAITGGARIDWAEGGPVTIADLRLGGADYGLSGSASVAGQTVTLDLLAELSVLARFSGLAGQDLGGAAEGRLSGTLALLDGAFDLDVGLTGTDIALGIDEADRLLAGRSEIAGGLRRDETGTTISDLNVAAQDVRARVDGTIRSTGTDLDAVLTFPDLAVLGPDYAGRLDAEARLEAAGDIQRVTATATGRDLAAGIDPLDRLLSGESRIGLEARIAGGTTFLDSFTLGATTLAVEGSGRLGPAGTDVSGRLDFADLGVLGPGYAGRLEGTARLLEAGGTQQIRFDAAGSDIALGIEAADALLAGGSRLTLEATRAEGEIDVERLLLSTDSGLSADGSGRIATERSDFSGRAALADLGVLGADFAGALTAEGSVTDTAGAQRVAASLIGNDLRIGVDEVDRLLAGQTRATLAADVTDGVVALDALELTTATGLSATATGRLEEGASDIAARLTLAGLGVLGPQYGGRLEADLRFREAGAERRLELDARGQDLAAGIDEVDRLLAGQTRARLAARMAGEVVDLDTLDLTTETGLTASASGRLVEGDSDIAATLALARLAALGPQYGGRLDADLRFQEAGAERRLQLDARGQDLAAGIPEVDRILRGASTLRLEASQLGDRLRVRGARLATPLLTAQADATVEGDRRRLDLNARLTDLAALVPGFGGPVTVQGNISDANADSYDIDLQGTGPGGLQARVAGRIARDLTAALSIAGNANLALANRFTDPVNIQGPVAFDLRLDGQPGLGALSGSVTTTDARIVSPQGNITLEGVNASARLGTGAMQIDANARVQEGGTVTAGGQIQLGNGFPADLTVTLNNARLTDRRIFQTSVSGSLNLGGPLTGGGGRITGGLNLGETEVRIPSTGLGTGGYVPPGMIHIGDSAAVRATRQRARVNGDDATGEPGNPLALDLTLSAPNRVFIRGRGLDAEMGGALRLSGTTADVVPAGEFGLIRGRLDILGRRFVLSEGLARLTGRFVPFVRLTATTFTDGITAQILVEGEADALEIRFLSVPELPEEEVVARILFGRGLDRLSPFQAAQLASAVATLAGRGGEGLVGGLRRGFGLDDLDITTQDDGTAALRAGRYLTENIYTDVTVDSEGRSEVSINLDVTSSVTVRARTDSDGRSGLGVFFERDY